MEVLLNIKSIALTHQKYSGMLITLPLQLEIIGSTIDMLELSIVCCWENFEETTSFPSLRTSSRSDLFFAMV